MNQYHPFAKAMIQFCNYCLGMSNLVVSLYLQFIYSAINKVVWAVSER